MRKILLATDFSDSADNAFDFVRKMTDQKPVKVDLVHVFDIPIPITSAYGTRAVLDFVKEQEYTVKRELKKRMSNLPEDQQGEIFAIQGAYPSTEIAEIAEKNSTDLIVMAMRQKYSYFESMLGSTTAHTIQKANIPVMAIPNGAGFTSLSTILFPTEMEVHDDLSQGDRNALEWLTNFWEFIDEPDVHLIHIADKSEEEKTYIKKMPVGNMEFIVSGAESVEQGIESYLQEHPINLIAFYKPNRSFWERLYHSSVSRRLLHNIRIPMLVFS